MRFSNLILLTILIAMLLAPPGEVRAQDLPAVQEVIGSLAPGQVDVFLISGLKAGQTLEAFMETRSGNLDPILFIVAADENLAATLESYQEAVAELAASSAQPLLDLPALRDQYTLAWGLLAWFMGYIPSIGFMIALIPPVLMAYAQYGLQKALVVLGGIGALLAVPLTLLVLVLMENFEDTRPMAILMRYTGEEKKEERKAAANQVKGLWGKVKGSFSSHRESEDIVEKDSIQ